MGKLRFGGALTALFILIVLLSFDDKNRFSNLSQSADFQEEKWVDSVFNSMDDALRFGQLFVIRGNLDQDTAYERSVDEIIRKYQPGGICLFNKNLTGTCEKQGELINRWQALSDRLPMIVSMDLENGLGMRLRSSTISYPRQLMLGAIQDNALIYEMGREIARQCRRIGVHCNFAPVADVNNNPANPVINERSFGEDRHNVTAKAYQYMMGLQDGNVLASVKHFPGHGDTEVDSHFDLPLIPHNRARLDSLELYPFEMLLRNGAGSVMVAHLNVPALDAREKRPTTLSRPVVHDLLRQKMGYQGLIFTDAMEMEGVAKYFKPGEADIEAFKAGNDVSLLPGDIGATIAQMPLALERGELDREAIYASVKRVLRAKYRLGLTRPQRVDMNNLRKDLNQPASLALKQKLVASAITLVRDEHNIIGFPNPEQLNIATLSLGDTNRTVFQTYCGYYAPVTHFNAAKDLDSLKQINLINSLKKFDAVLVSLHDTRSFAKFQYGLTDSELAFLRQLNGATKVGVVMFGNPYSLRFFEGMPTVLMAFTEDPMAQQQAAMICFGAADAKGHLPVTASPSSHFAQGIEHSFPQKRMGFALPESVGMNSDTLALMDGIIQEMIQTGAAPGCQVLVAKNGQIVWNKAYGYLTYAAQKPVTPEHLYDIASVTKVAASTVSLMKLYDDRKINLDNKVSNYIPELTKTNKKDLILRDILSHHAGLQPWIAFYQQTLDANKRPRADLYHKMPDEGYETEVARDLWLKTTWKDTLWQKIYDSPLREDRTYKYSDLGLYLGMKVIEQTTHQPLDIFARQQYYLPLGMSRTMFNPAEHGYSDQCAPTEEDQYFRYQTLQGYVHDMGAAMLGGVSGHAGLFSNTVDLAKLFQMLLNNGNYAGKQYLKPETIRAFTQRVPQSTRRGVGFDMKELDEKLPKNMSPLAGKNTFGHLGFTGTCVWADPDQQLIFIFLSNRTYPTMDNNKLGDGDFRPRLQSVAYRAIR